MYLIVRNKPDQYGLTAAPTHRHIPNYKKALAEFTRLTKLGTECKLMMDAEYRALYCLDGADAQGA